jgi:D-methionine transport system substrate-binding protein
MKKIIFKMMIAGTLILALGFGSCTGKKDAEKILSVGATPVPHAELLNLIKDDLAEQGITLKVVEFTDYVQPNMAVLAGELDANFFQHIPYLESNDEWALKLTSAFGVHVEPFGLYSLKHGDINDLPNGATIAIPNDPSNGGR